MNRNNIYNRLSNINILDDDKVYDKVYNAKIYFKVGLALMVTIAHLKILILDNINKYYQNNLTNLYLFLFL